LLLPFFSIGPALDPAGASVATPTPIERIAAQHIRSQVVKYVSLTIKASRSQPDDLEEYKEDYGSLGKSIKTL